MRRLGMFAAIGVTLLALAGNAVASPVSIEPAPSISADISIAPKAQLVEIVSPGIIGKEGLLPGIDSTADERVGTSSVMRHEYRQLSDAEKAQVKAIKDAGESFISLVDKMGSPRDRAIAKTKIEEAVMWGVKAVTAEPPAPKTDHHSV